MFGKSKRERLAGQEQSAKEREILQSLHQPQVKASAVASPAGPAAPEAATSSISSGLSVFGKIVGEGTLQIFGNVQGEVHASTVQIGEGAQVEGNIEAENLTIGGHVKGTIHANSVKLSSTAVVEGDIYHRSLAIEENAQFEGMSRRQENVIDQPSLVPAKRSSPQASGGNGRSTGAPDGLKPSQSQTASMES